MTSSSSGPKDRQTTSRIRRPYVVLMSCPLHESLRPDERGARGEDHQHEAESGEPGSHVAAHRVVADALANLVVHRVELVRALGGERLATAARGDLRHRLR